MRVTQKLKEAAWILSDEQFGDCATDDILQVVRKGKVTRAQIYKTVKSFGYRWDGTRWKMAYPSWLLNFLEDEDE